MKIENNKLTAEEGCLIYNKFNPEIYGEIIFLGINDNVNDWIEDKKIEEKDENDNN